MAGSIRCFLLLEVACGCCSKIYTEPEAHHRKKTFLEEYREMLDKFEVEYDEKYIFKEPE